MPITDVQMERSTEEKGKTEEEKQVPEYYTELELSEREKDELKKEILREFEYIKQEREQEGLDKKWDKLDKQYEDILLEDEDRQFNLHRHITKIKINAISETAGEAFFDQDPMFAVSPRPDSGDMKMKELYRICEKKQSFLDYKIDEVVPLAEKMEKVFHSAALKGTGILKLFPKVIRQRKQREETYKPEEIDSFLMKYPDKIGSAYEKQLREGKELNIAVAYTETIYNDPKPEHINLKDFYARLNTDGYMGLVETRLIVERQVHSWWDLKKRETGDPEGFFNLEELIYEDPKKKDKVRENYDNDDYDILECTYKYIRKEGDEPIKIKVWIDEKSKTLIGVSKYPTTDILCEYIPYHIRNKVDGFYQPGVGEDLTDDNIVADEVLNYFLEAIWIQNTVTPIAPLNSDAGKQFLEKEWAHGVPIDGEDVDFLEKPPINFNAFVAALEFIGRGADDVSGVSQLMTGRASEIDPSAPASKTLALLEVSGKAMKRYVQALMPSFNITATVLLMLYKDISRENIGYRVKGKPEDENPFDEIAPNELSLKTNIEARAMAFAFDKMNEKKEDVALYSLLRKEPLIARNPKSVHALLRNIVKNWSPKWKNLVDQILPTMDELNQKQMQAVTSGIMNAAKNANAIAAAGGGDPDITLQKLIEAGQKAQAQLVNNTEEEEEARE